MPIKPYFIQSTFVISATFTYISLVGYAVTFVQIPFFKKYG